MSKIYILTGPAGVGKTTLTKALAKNLKKCAILEGDEIYSQVYGSVKPWLEGNHTKLMWKNMCDLAWNYLENDIDVIMNYIITDEELNYIKNCLAKFELHFCTLMADRETIMKRDELRPEDEVVHRVDEHIKIFSSSAYGQKFVLNTTNMSVEQEVKEILSGRYLMQNVVDEYHFSGLRKEYFDLIESGKKKYEVRLNDEKRQKINIGERYVFGIVPEKRTLMYKIVMDKLYFNSFEELCNKLKPIEIGFETKEDAISAYKSFYLDEDIKKYGIVAFKLF